MIILLLFSLVPHTEPVVEVGHLKVNHIYDVNPEWKQITITNSYILGQRKNSEIYDWWRQYDGQRILQSDGKYYFLLYDKKYNRYVYIKSDKFSDVFTEYDVELRQRKEWQEQYGFNHKEYRRGLLGTKPQ